MPLYEFKCKQCDHEFEELIPYNDRDKEVLCKLCGSVSKRNMASSFGIHTTLDPRKDTILTKKEIDKVVGKDAADKYEGYNKRWKKRYEQRQQQRWKGRKPEILNIPKDSDGKYSPIMHLGDAKTKAIRKEFSEALVEHRTERESKGLRQFDGPGAITE
jgi:putative FmdB family regulatory protein